MGEYLDGLGASLWACRYLILAGVVIVSGLVWADHRNGRSR